MLRAQSLTPSYIQQNAIPGVYNLKSSNTVKWRAALARAATGGARATINCVGDSTTWGQGSGGSASTGVKAAAYPAALASIIGQETGFASQAQSWWGEGSTLATLPVSDPRVAFTGATARESLASVGGGMILLSAAGTLAFTPSANVDTFDIWYVKGTGNGTFSYSVDGGSATNVNSNTTGGPSKVTVSAGSSGSHTCTLTWVSGNCHIIGMEGYLSTDKVSVRNMGRASWTADDWDSTTASYSPLNALVSIAADLYIIDLGINDGKNGVSVADFSARMQTIITATKAVGDVALCVPAPSDSAIRSAAVQAEYAAAIYGLAQTNDLPLVDKDYRLISYTSGNAAGFYYDQTHLTGMGYRDVAMLTAKAIATP